MLSWLKNLAISKKGDKKESDASTYDSRERSEYSSADRQVRTEGDDIDSFSLSSFQQRTIDHFTEGNDFDAPVHWTRNEGKLNGKHGGKASGIAVAKWNPSSNFFQDEYFETEDTIGAIDYGRTDVRSPRSIGPENRSSRGQISTTEDFERDYALDLYRKKMCSRRNTMSCHGYRPEHRRPEFESRNFDDHEDFLIIDDFSSGSFGYEQSRQEGTFYSPKSSRDRYSNAMNEGPNSKRNHSSYARNMQAQTPHRHRQQHFHKHHVQDRLAMSVEFDYPDVHSPSDGSRGLQSHSRVNHISDIDWEMFEYYRREKRRRELIRHYGPHSLIKCPIPSGNSNVTPQGIKQPERRRDTIAGPHDIADSLRHFGGENGGATVAAAEGGHRWISTLPTRYNHEEFEDNLAEVSAKFEQDSLDVTDTLDCSEGDVMEKRKFMVGEGPSASGDVLEKKGNRILLYRHKVKKANQAQIMNGLNLRPIKSYRVSPKCLDEVVQFRTQFVFD